MQTLTLSHVGSRSKFGQSQLRHPSPFLKELPADLVERKAGLDRNEPPSEQMATAFFTQIKQMAK